MNSFSLPIRDLACVSKFTSSKPDYGLSNIQVEIRNGFAYLTATDSRAVCCVKSYFAGEGDDANEATFVVPQNIWGTIVKAKAPGVKMSLDAEKRTITVNVEGLSATVELRNDFPDWRRAVPDKQLYAPEAYVSCNPQIIANACNAYSIRHGLKKNQDVCPYLLAARQNEAAKRPNSVYVVFPDDKDLMVFAMGYQMSPIDFATLDIKSNFI